MVELEKKFIIMEQRLGQSEKMLRKTTMGQILSEYDMNDDEDLLENFDGIPRFSMIDLLD